MGEKAKGMTDNAKKKDHNKALEHSYMPRMPKGDLGRRGLEQGRVCEDKKGDRCIFPYGV